eukprot:3657116-Prymnesium_polylepis.1
MRQSGFGLSKQGRMPGRPTPCLECVSVNGLDIIPVGHAKHRGGSSGMAEAMEAQMRSSARVQCTIA